MNSPNVHSGCGASRRLSLAGSLLAAAGIALFAGCASGTDEGPSGAGGTALTVNGVPADATDGPLHAALLQNPNPRDPNPTIAERVSDGTIARLGTFDDRTFRTAVSDVASYYGDSVAAMPSAKARSFDEMNLAVIGLVSRATGVKPPDLGVVWRSCEVDGHVKCEEAFRYLLGARNSELASELVPITHQFVSVSHDVIIAIWSPAYQGLPVPSVLTLYGRYDNHLVGIINFF